MVKEIESIDEISPSGLVVVDFFATWCGPCKKIAPIYEQMEKMFPTITFLKVDVDEANDIAERFDIRAMPTFVFLKDGQRVAEIEGADVEGIGKTLERLTQ